MRAINFNNCLKLIHYFFVTVKHLKNKWRHIRDGFSRSLNKGKSGDAASSTKKIYTYADSLEFLLNTLDKRKTTGNLEDSDDNQLVTSEIDEHGANDDEDGNSESVIENQPQSSTRIANLPYRQKRKRQNSSNITAFQSQLLKKLDENEKKEEDGDKLFLLSLLPDYKKLNDDEKLDFKFMTLQFFRDIRRKKDFTNHPENFSVPNNFNQFYPGPSRSVQTTLHSQSLHTLTPIDPRTPLSYHNPLSPNDSQLSTETSSASSHMTYEFP